MTLAICSEYVEGAPTGCFWAIWEGFVPVLMASPDFGGFAASEGFLRGFLAVSGITRIPCVC